MKKKFVTLHECKKSKIILNNKTKKVHKILKDLYIDRPWFESYQKFQEGRSNIVKVFEYISDREYTMEYIPHLSDLEQIVKDPQYRNYLTKDFICDCIEIFNSAFVDGIRFSKNNTMNYFQEKTVADQKYFVHCDLKLSNFLVDENKKITLIDPDSFVWMNNLEGCEKFYMNQTNLMFCLQRYFSTMEGRIIV